MKIKIKEWQMGEWNTVPTEVLRITETMIVVRWGRGERRFNRKRGNATGRSKQGMAGMADPYIDFGELQRFEAELKVKG